LGEFLPFGRLFTLDSLFKITEVAQIFEQIKGKYCINFAIKLIYPQVGQFSQKLI
jgi:hypothetical protein